jgi:predicted acetyltransferase
MDPAVTVTLRDARPSAEDRTWIARHYPEYVNELAQRVSGSAEPFQLDGDHGNRQPEWLLRWFRDERTHPLLILSGGQPAGFALVARPWQPVAAPQSPVHEMAEFFIRAPHRRRGVGAEAAALIFRRFGGDWRVSEARRNTPAVAFWRRVIGSFTGGVFTERMVDGDVRHAFKTPVRPVSPTGHGIP